MTAAARLLTRLSDAGVSAEARNGRLILKPASAVPADLVADIREAKLDLLRLLKPAAPAAVEIRAEPCRGCAQSVWWQRTLGAEWTCYECSPPPDDWPPARRAIDLDERRALMAEPALPAPSSMARNLADARQAAVLAGLIEASRKRPPSWWNPERHTPPAGAVCSCCHGRTWSIRDGGYGWNCETCHPGFDFEREIVAT
jgi:hypothetical protein